MLEVAAGVEAGMQQERGIRGEITVDSPISQGQPLPKDGEQEAQADKTEAQRDPETHLYIFDTDYILQIAFVFSMLSLKCYHLAEVTFTSF